MGKWVTGMRQALLLGLKGEERLLSREIKMPDPPSLAFLANVPISLHPQSLSVPLPGATFFENTYIFWIYPILLVSSEFIVSLH